MSKVRVAGFGVSLDGYAAGTEQSFDHPLGKRGPELFQWFFPTRTFREMQGEAGGEPALTTGSHVARWTASVPSSWDGTCSGRSAASGRTTSGEDGGATSRPITRRPSCSRTIRGRRSRWTAGRPSTSSPMASKQRCSVRARQRATRTSRSAAVSGPCGSTSGPAWWTRSIWRWLPWSSVRVKRYSRASIFAPWDRTTEHVPTERATHVVLTR